MVTSFLERLKSDTLFRARLTLVIAIVISLVVVGGAFTSRVQESRAAKQLAQEISQNQTPVPEPSSTNPYDLTNPENPDDTTAVAEFGSEQVGDDVAVYVATSWAVQDPRMDDAAVIASLLDKATDPVLDLFRQRLSQGRILGGAEISKIEDVAGFKASGDAVRAVKVTLRITDSKSAVRTESYLVGLTRGFQDQNPKVATITKL